MSNLWATPLRDPRPNRRNGTMSKLQRRGDRSDAIYLTAKTPGFNVGSIPAGNVYLAKQRLSAKSQNEIRT